MKEGILLVKEKYPEVAELFRPVSKDEELRVRAEKLNLPTDYYAIYSLIDGEDEKSDGVFGLHRLLPLSSSIEQKITDLEELKDIRKKIQYDIFIPVFSTPGRQLIGYAKKGESWDFVEYDLWMARYRFDSITDFMKTFTEKLINNGYATEEGFNGLIDRDEM